MSIRTVISSNKKISGASAARHGAVLIREAIAERGRANIIVATGASQFEMLQTLVGEELPWNRVTVFHLDEYVGLPITHPASFRQYLWERFHRLLPNPPNQFHYINGESDPEAECDRLAALITGHPIDVCFAGIGENGHLAFNDPPADFQTSRPYLVVNLDEACRRQQLGEGWFSSLDAVPRQAISMSIRQILKSRSIILTVPDLRKAEAVRNTLERPISPDVPASILQTHVGTTLYLDPPSASLLK
ncbi:MAG: glucosamine-6-phosphate deaminase [Verrucomicrobia bacterium 61-8]|nr:glucosamine-6-phosphate deaminase [Verrucomicrobiota bacterium]OJV03932.1 MAG: glucosamine-6-phosphate deaminase [Verrucomicrobia bacterium 61-8]